MALERKRYRIAIDPVDPRDDSAECELLLTHDQYETVERVAAAIDDAGQGPEMTIEVVVADAS